MAAGHVDPTVKTNVLSNTVDNAVIDPVAIAAWYNNVANQIDANYDDALSKANSGTVMGDFRVSKSFPRHLLYNTDYGGTQSSLGNVTVGYVVDSSGQLRIFTQNSTKDAVVDRMIIPSGTDPELTFLNISKLKLGTVNIIYGTGTPEGVITAAIGSLFLRTDGAATTTLYVKTSGTGNTGWTAK